MTQFPESSFPPQGLRIRQLAQVLFVGLLWLYLPLEAFDTDAEVGFGDAVIGGYGCLGDSPSSATPIPDSAVGAPSWRELPSVTLLAALLPLYLPNSGADRQRRLLLAARLCARSRIAEPPFGPQQPDTNTHLVVRSRSFMDLLAVEGGFLYEEVRGHKTNADRSKEEREWCRYL